MNYFYKHIFRSSLLQMFFKIGALKNFAILRIKKRLQHRCFSVRSSHIILTCCQIFFSRHFHSSINHQEHLFHRTFTTSYFCPVNIAKFLRRAFIQNISRSSCLQMFFKIGAQNSFANFTGKHLCWSLFLKNLQAEALQLY